MRSNRNTLPAHPPVALNSLCLSSSDINLTIRLAKTLWKPRTKVEATVIGRYWAGEEGSVIFGISTVRAERMCTGNCRHQSKSLEILASISVCIFRSILADKPSGPGALLHSGGASRTSGNIIGANRARIFGSCCGSGEQTSRASAI